VFLGYGAPDSAAYWTLVDYKKSHTYNFNDTFVDLEHLRCVLISIRVCVIKCFTLECSASFPRQQIEFDSSDPSEFITPPFKITFPARSQPLLKEGDILVVKPYKHVNMGPYPQNVPRTNVIRFTPVQVEAIVSAMYPGLTMVVGPPGTGKTDVAVQIISNWYHNNPEQRTLLITHSNQTLNQLFEKIIYLDIDERHLLRLGMGEKDIDSKKVFTKYGRVNYILERRLLLLDEVQRLAESFGVQGDIGYTCETAGYFYLYSVLAKWEEFLSKIRHTAEDAELVSKAFPFHKYFASAPQPLFKKKSLREDFEIAEGCFRHLKKIFTELEEFKAFEILRTGSDRVDYLLVKEAKIIAMTCTHAALKRADLVKLRFQFDNVLLEEAGQILEIETFIPLMCQNPEDGRNRLKRVVLIGDHHQLPPIIKNQVFQKFCNMEQSMFSRFIRLNVPAVHLNAQGRARPSIATLFRWRYRDLGDLDHVHLGDQFKTANAGFLYEYQFIDVQDLNGAGETHPQPYFYQASFI
jgi:intron-binding protein aquarius